MKPDFFSNVFILFTITSNESQSNNILSGALMSSNWDSTKHKILEITSNNYKWNTNIYNKYMIYFLKKLFIQYYVRTVLNTD